MREATLDLWRAHRQFWQGQQRKEVTVRWGGAIPVETGGQDSGEFRLQACWQVVDWLLPAPQQFCER